MSRKNGLISALVVAAIFALAALVGHPPSAEAQVPVPNRAVTLTIAQKTVTLAATPETLGSGIARQVIIKPLDANTSTRIEVRSASGTAGFELYDGDALVLPLQTDLSAVFIRVLTNGDGVSYVAWRD